MFLFLKYIFSTPETQPSYWNSLFVLKKSKSMAGWSNGGYDYLPKARAQI